MHLVERLPFPLAVQELAHSFANMAGTLGIGMQIAGHIRMLQRFFNPKNNRFRREQPLLSANRCRVRSFALARCGSHDPEQCRPIYSSRAREMARVAVEQAQFVCSNQNKTGFIQTAPSGTAKHLHDLIRAQHLLGGVAPVGLRSQGHAAKREINACCQTHRGNDHTQLSRFYQRFDDSGACSVAESTMMIGDPRFEELP
ncbi:hypothetical protein SDC9_167175 [bioreactor metagenome]|uniref:Uncharacterized protein n=1 Tax=bioreactor metagenome TaxID=1076179 RepID=A0A645G794_9ZZZZ